MFLATWIDWNDSFYKNVLFYHSELHYRIDILFSLSTPSFTLTLFFFQVQWLEKYIYTQYRRRWYLKYIKGDKKTRVSILNLVIYRYAFSHIHSQNGDLIILLSCSTCCTIVIWQFFNKAKNKFFTAPPIKVAK